MAFQPVVVPPSDRVTAMNNMFKGSSTSSSTRSSMRGSKVIGCLATARYGCERGATWAMQPALVQQVETPHRPPPDPAAGGNE